MFTLMVVLHLLVSFCLIAVVLLQSGKGNGLTGAFGMGGNSTVFGGRGAVDFLGKATWVLGGAFMVTSLVLAILSGANTSGPAGSLIKKQAATAPAVPVPSSGAPSEATPSGAGAPGTGAATGAGTESPSSTEPTSGQPVGTTPSSTAPAVPGPAVPSGEPSVPAGGK